MNNINNRVASIITLIVFALATFPMQAQDIIESGDFKFQIDHDAHSAVVVGLSTSNQVGSTVNVVIPEMIEVESETYTVNEIGNYVFKGKRIRGITIPNSVTTINEGAFYKCTFHSGITIPNSVTTIREKAFYECSCYGGDFILPDNLTTICDYAFYKLYFRGDVVIPSKVRTIGNYAFYKSESSYDDQKYGLTLSDSLVSIGDYAFTGRRFKGMLVIPPSVTHIGKYAFRQCLFSGKLRIPSSIKIIENGTFEFSSFTELELPNTITSIGDSAFYWGNIQGELIIPNSVKTIGAYAFAYQNISNVSIPNSVTHLGEAAFYDNNYLTHVVLSENLISIENETFSSCNNLVNPLSLPSSIKCIGESAFSGCRSLNGKLILPADLETIGRHAFDGTRYTSVVFPNKLRSIEAYAFSSNRFTEVELPASITYLGDYALNSSEPTYVKCNATSPPKVDSDRGPFFYTIFSNATLEVPNTSVSLYKEARCWKQFYQIKGFDNEIQAQSISLNQNEAHLMVAEYIKLSATIIPETTTDKTVIWSTSDAAVATVDADGKVTGVKVGTATITATTANGLTATCKVTVLPRLATGITLDRNEVETVVGKSFSLNAEILPADAVQQAAWSSSDEAVVTVSHTGEVEVKGQGSALITASTTDGSGLSATCKVTVWLLGDTNGDGTVDIADVVNTTNYIAGNEVDRFVFVAGDINDDEDITVTDAVQIARIILAADTGAESTPRRIRAFLTDYMTADCAGNTVSLALSAGGYSAFQADVRLPHGVELNEVLAGAGCSASHTVMTAVRDDNMVRVVVFSLANEEFGNPGSTVVELRLSGIASEDNEIEVGNIVVSDASGKSSTMECRVSGDMSGIDATADGNGIGIRAVNGGVEVTGACGQTVSFFTPDGMMVCSHTASADVENIRLAGGVYLVAVDGSVNKIVVK